MTKDERKEYMKRWSKSPKGIAYQKRMKEYRKKQSQQLSEFMKSSGFKFNARNHNLHIDKLNTQEHKVGSLAEQLPNHYRQNGRTQYL